MADPRVEALAKLVGRVEGSACWLAGTATKGALAGGAAGLILWWFVAGEWIADWWQGTAGSVAVLVLCLLPAIWLLNVRMALVDLVELPDTLGGVAERRGIGLRGRDRPPPPQGGLLGAIRSVRGIVRDYGDVVGSWGTVAQLLAPTFWLVTAVAFLSVPVVAVAAAITALVNAA